MLIYAHSAHFAKVSVDPDSPCLKPCLSSVRPDLSSLVGSVTSVSITDHQHHMIRGVTRRGTRWYASG